VRVRWLNDTFSTKRTLRACIGDSAAADQAERVGELEALARFQSQDRAAEQDPAVELILRHPECDVIDGQQRRRFIDARVCGHEIDFFEARRVLAGRNELDGAAPPAR
jgi:hypothetical protein